MTGHSSDDIERIEQMRQVRNNLQEALDARKEVRASASDSKRSHPPVRYCLKCDEYVVAEKQGVFSRETLDCLDGGKYIEGEHANHVLEQDYRKFEIKWWIECIDHFVDSDSGRSGGDADA